MATDNRDTSPNMEGPHQRSPYVHNTIADDAGEAARMQAQAWRHVAQILAQAVRVWSWRCVD